MTTYDAQLEIDHTRGVLYVHCKKTGRTLLRICSLPKPIPDLGALGTIDLTHMKGVQYAVVPGDLGRFGHHPEPAVDFCVEVDAIEGLVEDVKAGTAQRIHVEDRIFKATMFLVGGDQRAVSARKRLLLTEEAVKVL